MDFEFFESLSLDDAKRFLDDFLGTESRAFSKMVESNFFHGINTDYTTSSISQIFLCFLEKMETIPRTPDHKLPWWIRETESYQKGLFDYDEYSSYLVLRAAYYLGESFVREFKNLRWGIGDTETVIGNMPIVSGFKRAMEMAPILITDNIFRGILAGEDSNDSIETTVEYWKNLV